jgi:hypothetical protein
MMKKSKGEEIKAGSVNLSPRIHHNVHTLKIIILLNY